MGTKTPPEIEKKIVDLLEKGLTSREIAKNLFGKASRKSTVNYVINRLGLRKPKNELKGYMTPKGSQKKIEQEKDNSRVLLISDLHFPYEHRDTLKFLEYLKEKYDPTRIISLGDELDQHCLSYHDSDPDLFSASGELNEAKKRVKNLKQLFPEMDILESNHGSLIWRKAKTHGIPKEYIKSYQDVIGVDDLWKWHFELTIDLPNGQKCYFTHGKTTDVVKLSQQMGMNAVQGHYHEKFGIQYWGNPTGLYWGLQVGCLVDDDSLAFSYNNTNIKRPIIGTGLIIDSQPVLEPMILDSNGRWIHR